MFNKTDQLKKIFFIKKLLFHTLSFFAQTCFRSIQIRSYSQTLGYLPGTINIAQLLPWKADGKQKKV